MFRLIIQCIRAFGWRGIKIYIQLKLYRTKNIQLAGIKYPFKIRPSKTDQITFKEIFIKKEYKIDLPKTIMPAIIVDAGANIGLTTLFFANLYPQAKVFSIEPDDDNFDILNHNIRRYALIKGIQSAVWNKKEGLTILDKGYGKRGLIIEKNGLGNSLQAISINDLMTEFEISSIDILKMDIEGSEKEVFSGNYEAWLPNTKCLIIELHDRMKPGCSKSLFQAISQYDFSLSIKGENLVFINNQYL